MFHEIITDQGVACVLQIFQVYGLVYEFFSSSSEGNVVTPAHMQLRLDEDWSDYTTENNVRNLH